MRWRCLLSAVLAVVPRLLVLLHTNPACAESNKTNKTNKTVGANDWYIGDHPMYYIMAQKRADNGTWVDNPDYLIPPFTVEEWRSNTMERVPWWIRWFVTGETRALRKEMLQRRKNIIDYVVSPMDYGRSLRAQSVRAQWHEQLRHFWTEAMGTYVWKNLKRNAQYLLFGGMRAFIDQELYFKNISGLNTTEYARFHNMSDDEIQQIQSRVAEEIRDKLTRTYRFKIPADLDTGVQLTVPAVGRTVQFFQPYANYTSRYYNAEEELPPPTMPAAISYPWPWRDRIDQLRAVLVEVMRVEAATNSLAAAAARNNATRGTSSSHRGLQGELEDSYEEDGSDSAGSSDQADEVVVDEASKAAAIDMLEQRTKEFHFTTGIPRMGMPNDRFSAVVFPSLHAFFNLTIDAEANGSVSVTPQELTSPFVEPEAGDPTPPTAQFNYSSRAGVYAAAKHFYSFDTVENGYLREKDYYQPPTEPPQVPTDGTVLVQDITPKEKIILAECSATAPCSARSGVTVYSPSLASAVAEIFGNVSSSRAEPDTRRQRRQDWFLHIFQQAFEAEKRVLRCGLVAPSTVRHSFFDRDTDWLADNVYGFVNASKALAADSGVDVEPRQIFTALIQNGSSPLMSGFSYFLQTHSRTKIAMVKTHSVPTFTPFTDEQLVDLVDYLRELIRELQEAVDQYQLKRDADPMHIAIVNTTEQATYYDGRLFGVLGYGYFLPATNKANVAYRDHTLPEPFHLVMRVLVRLQESHLMIPDESIHVAACLAMLQFNVRYYRCNEMKQEEGATPRPMREEGDDNKDPLPPPPSSRTLKTSAPAASTSTEIVTAIASTDAPRVTPQTVSLVWS